MSKRTQEEMIGFVMIIVLVAIIALVFLAIGLRKPQELRESREIGGFLQASMLVSVSCFENEFSSLKSLIGRCYENKDCSNKHACLVLNESLERIISSAFAVGEEERYRSYRFMIKENKNTIVSLFKGKETRNKLGYSLAIPVSRENIYVILELSY